MANGKHRDSILTDIGHWELPTLGPEADDCLRRILRLSDTRQVQALEQELDEWLAGVERTTVSSWLLSPTMYLAELEPEKVAALTESLKKLLAERVRDATERGWEVE